MEVLLLVGRERRDSTGGHDLARRFESASVDRDADCVEIDGGAKHAYQDVRLEQSNQDLDSPQI